VLTIFFVMLGEVLIFLPSIANFRVQWLKTHIAQAEIAALAALAAPDQILDEQLRGTILMGAGVDAVAVSGGGKRRLILQGSDEAMVDETFDLRSGMYIDKIGQALRVLFVERDRLIAVIDKPPAMTGEVIEISVHEWPMRDAMVDYALNVLMISVLLSLIVASLIFITLNRLLVRPMQRLSLNMMQFGEKPEDPSRLIQPTSRADEIGVAERELQTMQTQLQGSLQQKNHLAALGLAVSKVSHDLRNMLTSAQLISDRMSDVKDPTVQRFAPKLISSLDRAINFLNQTLKYGGAQEAPPQKQRLLLRPIVDEVLESLAFMAEPHIKLLNEADKVANVDADKEQLIRILTNLARNSVQALETSDKKLKQLRITATHELASSTIEISDNGPGIPFAIRSKVFEAFQTAARAGGTGLGLAIAAELVQAHGGTIVIKKSDETGTCFKINFPDMDAR
jgi:signal transduction histidine kinase